LMRAMRRIQGKGNSKHNTKDQLCGSRGIFQTARSRGQNTAELYIAQAMMEYRLYKDPSHLKIFGRALNLFADDEKLAAIYIKFLLDTDDYASKLKIIFPASNAHAH
jgi:cleavage stimulation factor subunit 3